MARFVSFLVLVAILVIISIIFFQVMAGFFVPLFMAALLGVVVQPLYQYFLVKLWGKPYLAAGMTTTLVAVMVLLPIGLVTTTATLESLSLIDQLQLQNVRLRLSQLRHDFSLEIPREKDLRRIEVVLKLWRERQRLGESVDVSPKQVDNLLLRVRELEKWLEDQGDAAPHANVEGLTTALTTLRDSERDSIERDVALAEADAEFRTFKRNLLGGTYRAWLTEWANPTDDEIDQLRNAVLTAAGPVLSWGRGTILLLAKLGFGTLIMIVALFFLLAEGDRMLTGLIAISPLEEQHVRTLAAEFHRACRAIVSATLLSAVAQGLLAGLGFYFCGLRSSVALLMLMTMVLALVPFTGAAAVWIPVSLYLYFYQGSSWAAGGMALYGALVISTVDNIIKPLVLHGQSKLHPLLALLSVLGGIQALGPIGIVVGPMCVVFLQTLLKIVQRELASMDRSSWTLWRGFSGPPTDVTPTAATIAAAVAAEGATEPGKKPTSPSDNGHPPAKAPAKPPEQHGKKRKR